MINFINHVIFFGHTATPLILLRYSAPYPDYQKKRWRDSFNSGYTSISCAKLSGSSLVEVVSCTSKENSFPSATNIAAFLSSKAFASSFFTFLLNALVSHHLKRFRFFINFIITQYKVVPDIITSFQ